MNWHQQAPLVDWRCLTLTRKLKRTQTVSLNNKQNTNNTTSAVMGDLRICITIDTLRTIQSSGGQQKFSCFSPLSVANRKRYRKKLSGTAQQKQHRLPGSKRLPLRPASRHLRTD